MRGQDIASAAPSTEGQEFFLEALAAAPRAALLLDYDGTLAPFRSLRRCAFPYAKVPELLHGIIWNTNTRLVLITGRPAMELKSLMPLFPVPEIWGSHGLERLTVDGRHEMAEIPPDAADALAVVAGGLLSEGLETVTEFKPGAAAVHWRGLSRPLITDIRRSVARIWTRLEPQNILSLSEFDGGMEFRLRLRDKGDAVRQILCELDPHVPVAYLGDDWTDEDAFRALKKRGLAVLVRSEFRTTAADTWLKPPEGVVQFLERWLLACGGRMQ